MAFMIATLYDTTEWNVFSEQALAGIDTLMKLMRYGCYGLCMIKLLVDVYYDRRRMIVFGVALAILVIGYFGNHNNMLVLYSTIFIAADDIDSDWIVKIALLCQSLIFIVTVGLAELGIVDNVIWDATSARPRYFMGFAWVTTASILFLFMALEYIYLKRGRINIAEYGVMMVINYWLYRLTDTRMATIILIFGATFFLIFGWEMKKGHITYRLRVLWTAVPFILAVVTILLQYVYYPGNALLSKLNDLLSGRLQYGNNGIAEYGFSLFGRQITWVGYSNDWKSGMKYNYVDSSYLQVALEFGVVILLLVLMMYSILIYTSIRNGKYYISWIIMIVLLLCVTEPRLVKLAFNPFLLLSVTESIEYMRNRNKNRDIVKYEETEIINS